MKWRSRRVAPSNSTLPSTAVVCAICRGDTLQDPEISRTYIYVGETRDLQRRLNEHLRGNDGNPGLRKYNGNNYDDAVCLVRAGRRRPDERCPGPPRLCLRPRLDAAGNQPANHEDHT